MSEKQIKKGPVKSFIDSLWGIAVLCLFFFIIGECNGGDWNREWENAKLFVTLFVIGFLIWKIWKNCKTESLISESYQVLKKVVTENRNKILEYYKEEELEDVRDCFFLLSQVDSLETSYLRDKRNRKEIFEHDGYWGRLVRSKDAQVANNKLEEHFFLNDKEEECVVIRSRRNPTIDSWQGVSMWDREPQISIQEMKESLEKYLQLLKEHQDSENWERNYSNKTYGELKSYFSK